MKTVCRFVRLLALTGFVRSAVAQEVSIPDPGLNAAIRQALGKATGDITVQDMEGLRELDASLNGRGGGGRIQTLKGLEAAKSLTSLNLAGGGGGYFWGVPSPIIPGLVLTDLTPLAGLTNLTSLDLQRNQLTNLSLPAGLTSLTTLNLGFNQLTNFSFLSGLPSLTSLLLGYGLGL